MSKKSIRQQLLEAKQKIDKKLAERPSDLVKLVESQMENYELIIAAQSITDELQRMAEKSAALEADDIMPLVDGLRSYFGREAATRFNDVTTEAVRGVVEAIQSAKDRIAEEIIRLENQVDGEPYNDMSMEVSDEAVDNFDDEEIEADEVSVTDEVSDEPSEEEVDDEFDAIFDVQDGGAAGRIRKESVEYVTEDSKWAGLNDMERGYVEGILKTNRMADGFKHKTIADFEPAAIKRIKSDVARFKKEAGDDLHDTDTKKKISDEEIGYVFWLARNRHGRGFWDGEWTGDAAHHLSQIAHRYGQVEPYVNDDGKVALSGSVSESICESFARAVARGNKGIVAAKMVAESFGVSVAEVGRTLKEDAYDSLDEFTRGYIEAMLWASELDDKNVSDIDAESLQSIIADCASFQASPQWKVHRDEMNDIQGGHDFFLTRNGHGTGFWDRDISKKAGDQLTELSKSFGETFVYVGDNGKVDVS